MSVVQMSKELRQDDSGFLKARRGVIAVSLAAGAAMGVIALFQVGITRHVPEPPFPGLDADRVDGDPSAYKALRTPDALLGFVSYGVTAALAGAMGKDRWREHPWLPLMLGAKVGFDVIQAVRLTLKQWTDFRAFCSWCLAASAMTAITVPLVVPEAVAAARQILGRPHK